MTFAQPGVIGTENRGHVREFRQRVLERFVNQDLLRRVGKMIVSANDMRDFHERIVDHHRIVICRPAIRPEKNRIADDVARKLHGAMNDVVKPNRPFTHFETYNRRLLRSQSRLDDVLR